MKNYSAHILYALFIVVAFGCAATEARVARPVNVDKPKIVDINTVISQLSRQISSTMLEQNQRKVAVMNLSLVAGETTELGIYLADKLTNSLFQYRDKFEVVERTRLESVLQEAKLGLTGLIDEKTAQSIGKVLGADAIVIGTITDLGGEVDINLRMLGTERANVLAVASSLLEKSDAIAKLMANVGVIEPGKVESPNPQQKSISKVEINDLTFEARGIKRNGARLSCDLIVVNNQKETRQLRLILATIKGYTLLIDNFGNQYKVHGILFGGNSTNGYSGEVSYNIPPSLPMLINLEVRDVSPNASTANIIINCATFDGPILGFSPTWNFFQAILRNIPVTR